MKFVLLLVIFSVQAVIAGEAEIGDSTRERITDLLLKLKFIHATEEVKSIDLEKIYERRGKKIENYSVGTETPEYVHISLGLVGDNVDRILNCTHVKKEFQTLDKEIALEKAICYFKILWPLFDLSSFELVEMYEKFGDWHFYWFRKYNGFLSIQGVTIELLRGESFIHTARGGSIDYTQTCKTVVNISRKEAVQTARRNLIKNFDEICKVKSAKYFVKKTTVTEAMDVYAEIPDSFDKSKPIILYPNRAFASKVEWIAIENDLLPYSGDKLKLAWVVGFWIEKQLINKETGSEFTVFKDIAFYIDAKTGDILGGHKPKRFRRDKK